jgi:hypothetical protein
MHVLVSDGKGGFAEDRLDVRTGDAADRVLGKVTDRDGAAVAAATVEVDDQRVLTAADGEFNFTLAGGARHLLRVHKAGFATVTKAFEGSAAELQPVLRPVRATRFGYTDRAEAHDAENDVAVVLEPRSLLPVGGGRPDTSLSVEVDGLTYLEQPLMPGDRSGLDAAGTPIAVQLFAAVAVAIHDDQGRAYQIAPGNTARVTFPGPPRAPGQAMARSLPLFHYDEARGLWQRAGSALATGADTDRYTAAVTSFSAWAVGTLIEDSACIRVDVDDNALERPFILRVDTALVPDSGVLQGAETYAGLWAPLDELVVSDAHNALFGLSRYTAYKLTVLPISEPRHPIRTVIVNSGAAANTTDHTYPYDYCNGYARLGAHLPGQNWLNRWANTQEQAEQYYALIGADARPTFDDWLAVNGFTDADRAGEVVFLNPNELGLGRRMNCKLVGEADSGRVACYVTKYGAPSEPHAMSLEFATHDLFPGDTVAIESNLGYDRTKFFAYGPDGHLKTHTSFDPQGPKALPFVCLHCHGGEPRALPVHPITNPDFGSRMVPIDPTAYRFPSEEGSSPYRRSQQEERIREINQLIAGTIFSEERSELIHGLYPDGLEAPGSSATPFIPASWQGREQLYLEAVKPACMTCHVDRSPWNWQDFTRLRDERYFVQTDICDGMMPNALAPMMRLFRSTDPHWPDALLDALGTEPCNERFEPDRNRPPVVTIVAPTADTAIDAGGFFSSTALSATASDPEGRCCTFEWRITSGAPGFSEVVPGNDLTYNFGQPGQYTLTAVAHDFDGRSGEASIAITAQNQAPLPRIVTPAVNANLIAGFPNVFEAHADDDNEVFGLACDALRWTSSVAADFPTPTFGCYPKVTLSTVGARTLTVTAQDSAGATGSASVFVAVVPPSSGPPQPLIEAPHNGVSLDPALTYELSGSALDPDGTAITGYRWAARVGNGAEFTLGQTAGGPTTELPFNPYAALLPEVGNPCGTSVTVHLLLYATDSQGQTQSTSITIGVLYSAC